MLEQIVRERWRDILSFTLCRINIHSRRSTQVHKFNGGNTCWLCKNCRLIVRYDR